MTNILHEILDEQEQTYVQQFLNNEAMSNAVKKAMLANVYYTGVLTKTKKPNAARNVAFELVSNPNVKFSNEEIGQKLNEMWNGIRFVETSFADMQAFKEVNKLKVEKDKRHI